MKFTLLLITLIVATFSVGFSVTDPGDPAPDAALRDK